MGQLMDMLKKASRGPSQPLGFARKNNEGKVAPILLLGSVPVGDSSAMKKLVEAGLNAAVVTVNSEVRKSQFTSIAQELKDLVWGTWQKRVDSSQAEGADFEIFSSDETPMGALDGDDRTMVMQVTPELDDSLLRTIEDLPVDAFLVSLADAPSLTVRQLMRISRVHAVNSKYLLVHLSTLPSKEELAQLRDAGVGGLVVDVAAHSVDEIRACRTRLDELPHAAPQRNDERFSATLPSLRSAARPTPQEEEDDDDYDDDP
jgi:hypothetical protein